MGNIFGDTDDITFGSSPHSPNLPNDEDDLFAPRAKKSLPTPIPPRPATREATTPYKKPYTERPARPATPYPRPVSQPITPVVETIGACLTHLIGSMKPTYFPPVSSDIIRMVILSATLDRDPLMLVRTGDVTLLLGTGFGTTENAGKTYPTLPDMRLVASEKERLGGWVLLTPDFDIISFQMICEMLGFPFIYGSIDVIAYIRNNIKDTAFLEKCRFFELFADGADERKITDFTLKNTPQGLSIETTQSGFIDAIHAIDTDARPTSRQSILSREDGVYHLGEKEVSFGPGEILDLSHAKIFKNQLKFTFDTFYRDEKSVGVVAGYALKDRNELAQNGVLTFVLEEDAANRAIVGHIFIDSRGFVHAHEMMNVHKQILKGIRHIYEDAITANTRIERGELVQALRRELTKYCYLITGRTPVVMPIIIER